MGKANMKASLRTFVAIVGAVTFLWTSAGNSGAQDDPKNEQLDKKAAALDKVANAINEAPYISTYYVTPKVNVGENAVIDYYVTDYNNRDFVFDDHSLLFTVDYWINNEKTTLNNVKAGDQRLTIPSLPKGKVLLALQATDQQGRKSHRLFQEFLVVDPAEEKIPDDKIYHPDLQKFGIFSDDTHPVETTQGLTEMLKWASDNQYRKVLLPKGRYRLDENSTVQMATRLTLDMNGSTFKLNPNALGRTMMFEIVNCFDSHVINGTFEGDLNEHDFKNAPNNSEWVHAVLLGQDATYCSYENIKVVDVTGYGTVTTMGGSGIKAYTAATAKAGNFVLGDIDAKGNAVTSEVRMTTDKLVELTKFKDTFGFFQLGLYLGYQGNPTGNWVYKSHFYDADQKYLETIEGYLYRRTYIPQNAKFVRITVYGASVPEKVSKLTLFNFRLPLNCVFRNVQHENVRCVGMCTSGFNNLLVEGCTFENCGMKSAKCAFDSEDGWDMSQDLMFRNNKFGTNPNSEFVCISGHNFTVENNVMKASIRNRYYTVRNNQLKSATFQFGTELSSGTPRVYSNVVDGAVTLASKSLRKTTPPYRQFCVRDNVCHGGVFTRANKENQDVSYFYKCKIEGGKIGAKVVQCDLKNMQNIEHGPGFEIHKSVVDGSLLRTSHGGNIIIVDSKVSHSQFEPSLGSKVLLENNTLINCTGSGGMENQTWTLRGNKVETTLDNLLHFTKYFPSLVVEKNAIASTSSNFSAILLSELRIKTLTHQEMKITGNTFNAQGGTMLNMPRLSGGTGLLTISLFGNTYSKISEISKDAKDSPNVKILRQ